MSIKNVLVFPCGTEIGLEINRALSCEKNVKLFGASSIDDHGKYVYKNYITGIPFFNEDNFIQELRKVVIKNNIDIIFPAHDGVVLKLAECAKELPCIVVTSSTETCKLARSKLQTYKKLENIIPTPKIYLEQRDIEFPAFIKPDVGQGAKGCKKITSFDEYIPYINNKDYLCLEFLPGREYTIDCFTNKEGQLIYCAGRQRARILNGISVNSFIVDDPRFYSYAKLINDSIDFRGMWFFQVKEDKNGRLTLLEIATRCAGTMALQRLRGVNLPLLSLWDALDYDVRTLVNPYKVTIDRALENVFKVKIDFNEIFCDFDDCCVIRDKINDRLIAFLLKNISNGKKITLISRHDGNLEKALKKYRLHNFFDRVIHIKDGSMKSSHIDNKNSIFIDDSFKERADVHEVLNIPVFSVDMINENIIFE